MWGVVMTTASILTIDWFSSKVNDLPGPLRGAVMKATWEVCINTIKVLGEVVLPRCLSGREIVNVNEDSSTSTRRVPSRAIFYGRE